MIGSMGIRRKARPASYRNLTGEERLAQVICSAVHASGCACDLNRMESTCSLMLWAAKRVQKHLSEREGR
jgi:hypothetical protein